MKDPVLFVALDVDDSREAESISESLSGSGVGFKLGPRLIHREGARLVRAIAKHGPVFVDCKHFDIPSTMEAAIRTAFDSGAQYSTIHALSGPVAIAQLAKLEREFNRERLFRILTVTVLTSFTSESLPVGLRGRDIGGLVQDLAKDTYQNGEGLKSFVCSPHEALVLRQTFSDSFIVTPGVRPSGTDVGDQVRVETPARASQAGASAMVVGRPILAAKDRRAYALSIVDEFERAKVKT